MVEISPKLIVDDVERKRIDSRVDEREPKTCCLEHKPVLVEPDIKVMPAEKVGVARCPAHEEDNDKD